MSTQSNCPSSTKLLKTIGEKPLDPKRGNKVDTTAGKEKQPTAGQTAGQTTNQTTGQTTRQTTGQTAGKKAGKKAVGKKTVDTADLESDSSISRGISIKDDKQQQPGDGPHGETPVQRRRRKAGAGIANDWVPQRDADGHPLQPLQTRGLLNIGNLCYRNSILQCLFHEPAFAQWIRFHHARNTCNVKRLKCIACGIAQLMYWYWSPDSAVNQPFGNHLSLFQRTLNRAGWKSLTEQEDAHDLYIFMARRIHEQLNSEYDLISHTLSLRTRRTIFMECCSHTLTSYDEEYSLGVNCMEAAPKVQKIRNLIKQTMIGYIEVACPKCGKRESNRKYHLHIEAAPAVLAIHIRRFDWEMENDRLKKINDVVSFGPRLDLSKYYVPNKPVRKQSLKYKLVGVVNHQGTLKGGHYIATVKQPDIDEGPKTKPDKKTKRGRSSDAADAPADGKWMLADDGKISVSSLAEAQSTRETRGGFTPYILFYKRY